MEIAFTRRYGIGVEFVPARGGAIVQRMVSEAKSGVQYFDLHIGGTESVVSAMLPENVLEPVEPYFILPEVKDPKQWWGGHIWIDNAKKYVYNFVAYQTVSLWSNPNEYKPAEFKSFDDLLNPKLHGTDRHQRSAHARLRFIDVVLHELHQGRRIPQKIRRTEIVRHSRSALARGESGERQDRGDFRDRLFGVPAVYQSQSAGRLRCPCPRKGSMPAAATATWSS